VDYYESEQVGAADIIDAFVAYDITLSVESNFAFHERYTDPSVQYGYLFGVFDTFYESEGLLSGDQRDERSRTGYFSFFISADRSFAVSFSGIEGTIPAPQYLAIWQKNEEQN